jgi:hypothetical protein
MSRKLELLRFHRAKPSQNGHKGTRTLGKVRTQFLHSYPHFSQESVSLVLPFRPRARSILGTNRLFRFISPLAYLCARLIGARFALLRNSYIRLASQQGICSAITRPISREAVAAGEGALQTWTADGPLTIRKSSTRPPSGRRA